MTTYVDAAPAEFRRRVHKALKCWHDYHPREGLLDDMLIAHQHAVGKAMTRRQSTNLVLEQGLAQLATVSPVFAELLDLRFCTCLHVRETRQQIHYAESTIYFKQNQAIALLAAILYRLELTAWQERAGKLEGRLETPSMTLVGVDAQVTQLASLLSQAQGPWLVSIEGMGGIGKTTLAAAVLRRLARTTSYDGFAWISAQTATLDLCGEVRPCVRPATTSTAIVECLVQQLMPGRVRTTTAHCGSALSALRVHLQQCPHLIVIDNWETMVDQAATLHLLHSLANPSKFILTSRCRLIAEPGVHLHCVPELSKADALLLMRQAALAHELTPVLGSSDEELLPIYYAVGGNPLALLLAVNQTHVRPLHGVIADLGASHIRAFDSLFSFILQRAWSELGELERQVLSTLPLLEKRRLDVEEISQVCGRSAAETACALRRLIQADLVFTAGDLDGCQYHTHNLTRTFLQQSALRCPC